MPRPADSWDRRAVADRIRTHPAGPHPCWRHKFGRDYGSQQFVHGAATLFRLHDGALNLILRLEVTEHEINSKIRASGNKLRACDFVTRRAAWFRSSTHLRSTSLDGFATPEHPRLPLASAGRDLQEYVSPLGPRKRGRSRAPCPGKRRLEATSSRRGAWFRDNRHTV